ncbi:hypothetical protein F5Y18DRAFT_429200 [Xylariaceae sp. FL1019]|nr:hypothetical protein F5Y18DRAFT_429200 [Xylariaceae sp. FL1019]
MLLRLIHLAQLVITAYGATHSQAAIQNLLKYEDATKKAAKISGEAETQLHRTRTTQASGAVALLVSFFSAALLFFYGPSYGFLVRYLASPVVAAGVFAAKTHLQDFWTGKGGNKMSPKVPLPKMDGYNEALDRTGKLLEVLGWLTISWAASAVVALLVGY